MVLESSSPPADRMREKYIGTVGSDAIVLYLCGLIDEKCCLFGVWKVNRVSNFNQLLWKGIIGGWAMQMNER